MVYGCLSRMPARVGASTPSVLNQGTIEYFMAETSINCEVLATEGFEQTRKFIEGVHTKFTPTSINRAHEIPRFYYQVLRENLPTEKFQ